VTSGRREPECRGIRGIGAHRRVGADVGSGDAEALGHGRAGPRSRSAAAAVPDLDRLRAAMLEPDWVAEEPDAHLLPHMQRLCADRGWSVARAEVVDAVLEVDVTASGADARSAQEVGFALVGTFAEASTHLVDVGPGGGRQTELLVTTGMLEGDGRFAPHGHAVLLRVRLD
jgi:uncharacterized protein YihD (DUF1040 family)